MPFAALLGYFYHTNMGKYLLLYFVYLVMYCCYVLQTSFDKISFNSFLNSCILFEVVHFVYVESDACIFTFISRVK